MIDLRSPHSVVIDDIVFPDGQTRMGVLGGGGPQAAFGMRLWASGGVGLCGSVGEDFPAFTPRPGSTRVGIDTAGVRRDPEHTLSARLAVHGGGWPPHPSLAHAGRGASPAILPLGRIRFRQPTGRPKAFIWGCTRKNRICSWWLRSGRGASASASNPFVLPLSPLTDHEVRTLVTAGDLFSPNVGEAVSLVGPGEPEELVAQAGCCGRQSRGAAAGCRRRLALRSGGRRDLARACAAHHGRGPGGGRQRLLRRALGGVGGDGRPVHRAGMYAAVAASFLVEQVGLPPLRGDLRAEAERRLAAARNLSLH